MSSNLILKTDSYKVSHWRQYPPRTSEVYSYFESRGGEFSEMVFFGLKYILERHFMSPVSTKDVEEADEFLTAHLGPGIFNKDGWEHIVRDHKGFLPIEVRAVPEGTIVPTRNVLMTIRNTCARCFWATNYAETLLVQAWYPITVATISREIKKVIKKHLVETGDVAGLPFKLHDFGFRGVSSTESAGIGGAAHLVNFMGTDTMEGLVIVRKVYGEPMAGFSIPATEHSTITAWTKSREKQAYENMLDQFPKGLVAVVSDSYDIFNACRKIWGEDLKSKVLSRKGTLVVRPDSGVPYEVVPRVLNILGEQLGFKVNGKGFKVLDDHVRVIQGDGVDLQEIGRVLEAMAAAKWSADNIAFGMGGALLQKLNRDTQKFAFKCSNIVVGKEDLPVSKSPIGDPSKASKPGRLKLVKENGRLTTISSVDPDWQGAISFKDIKDELQTVFLNGKMLVNPTFKEIRQRADVP